MSMFSRRSFAIGAAASAIASPFLRSLRATAATPPRRLVLFFTPCGYGVNWNDWATKTGAGPGDFTFGQTFAPLTPHKGDLTILDGVDMKAASGGPTGEHSRGPAQVWTGTPLGDHTSDPNYQWATGISVDQHLAQKLAPPTKFASLELGVQSGTSGSTFNRTSYTGPRKSVAPESNPFEAYRRIFANLSTAPGTPNACVTPSFSITHTAPSIALILAMACSPCRLSDRLL